MKKHYYITNGKGTMERYQILTSKEDASANEVVNVVDELESSCFPFEVHSTSLVSITREDYDHLEKLVNNWDNNNQKEFYEKAAKLVNQ